MLRWTFWNPARPSFSARIVFEPTFLAVLPREASAGRWPMRKLRFAPRFCTTSGWSLPTVATIGLKSMARMLRAISARSIKCRPSAPIWFGWRSLCIPPGNPDTVGRRDSAGPSRRRPRLSGSGPRTGAAAGSRGNLRKISADEVQIRIPKSPGRALPAQPGRTSLDLDRRCCTHRRLHVARQSNPNGITNHGGSAV